MGLADIIKSDEKIIDQQIQDIIDKKSTRIVIGKNFALTKEQWEKILSLSELTHLEIIGRPLEQSDPPELETR